MDILLSAGSTQGISTPVLAAGSTTTLSTTGAINTTIRGRNVTKTALSNTASPTTDANTGAAFVAIPALKCCNFIVGVDINGNLKAIQGRQEDLNSDGSYRFLPQFPPVPSDFGPFGLITIKAAANASSAPGWVFGASNWAAVTGITATFDDLGSIPDRPTVAT